MKQRIAILTSGGDAPGMNAAVRAATMLALAHDWEVLGVSQGYAGLLDGELAPLTAGDVAPILRSGGTILGSARCPEFKEPAARDQARAVLREHRVAGLVVIGGNGSLAGAYALSDPDESKGAPPRVVGLPASIDNDIGHTGTCIGVDTAMNTIVEACDKISDTADAHDRTFLVEVMGRASGYLAMTSAIAAGADAVLFPEAGRTDEEVVDKIVATVKRVRAREDRSRRVMVLKAEGVGMPIEELKRRVDERLAASPGPGKRTALETRVTILGHVQRGGRPTAFDRVLASRLAHVAVRALLDGRSRKMAGWMPAMPPPAGVAEPTDADPYCWLLDLGAVLEETDRLLARTSPLVKWRAKVFDEVESVLTL